MKSAIVRTFGFEAARVARGKTMGAYIPGESPQPMRGRARNSRMNDDTMSELERSGCCTRALT